jgi:hypothetical protein
VVIDPKTSGPLAGPAAVPSLGLVATGAAKVHRADPAVSKLQFMLDLPVEDDVLAGDARTVLAVADPSLDAIFTRQATAIELLAEGVREGRRSFIAKSPVPRARWFMPVTGVLTSRWRRP